MRQIVILVGAGLLALGVASCPRSASGAALPLVSGNLQIANTFLHGDAHVALVGDSIQNTLVGAYPAVWKVDRWVGETTGADLVTNGFGNTGTATSTPLQPLPSFVSSFETGGPGSTTSDGLNGISPSHSLHWTFNGQSASSDTSASANRYFDAWLTNPQNGTFYPGKWADRSDRNLNAEVIYYANPNGTDKGLFDVLINSNDVPVVSQPLNFHSAVSGLQSTTVTFPAQNWSSTSPGLSGSFRIAPGQSPAAGSNAVLVGVRFYTGETGFQLSDLHQGGVGIDYFADPASAPQTAINQYVNLTDTNMMMIWIGQNDPGKYDGAGWKTQMQSLIARYKAARPGMQFILVSSYDTGNSRLADYAQDLYDISQTDSSVLFLNLYEQAGSFSQIDSNYLVDHVHPNLAGDTYFPAQLESLIESAATMSQVPEPSSGMVLLTGLLFAAGRRVRRKCMGGGTEPVAAD